MDEIKESIKENLKHKLVSPFWGAFILSWLVCNWKIWYVTFFVDSGLLLQSRNMLKIDYINNIYVWSSWEIIYSILHLVVAPLISSYLIVFWLPKITRHYYKKSLDFEYENKELREIREKRYLDSKIGKLFSQEEVIKKEKNIEQIKSGKTQEERWDEEYENFKSSRYYSSFELIKKCIYDNNGWTTNLSFQVRAYFDASGLIQNVEGKTNQIELTDKGRNFMKRYTGEVS